jgi:hypothetical protein
MADFIDILSKLVLRHENLVNVLAQGFTEHAALLLQQCEKCCCSDCKTEATVRHQVLGMRCCDRCAARLITKSRKNIGIDTNLDMNLLRGMVMQEELWVDLPGAIGIRRAQDLVTFASYNLEPDVPERGSTEWQ